MYARTRRFRAQTIIISYGTRKRRRRRQSCAIILSSFASSFVSPQETYNIILFRRDKINGMYVCTHTVRIVSARTHMTHTHTTYYYIGYARINIPEIVLSCFPTKGLTCSGIWLGRNSTSGFITLDYCNRYIILLYRRMFVCYMFFPEAFLLCATPRPIPIRI